MKRNVNIQEIKKLVVNDGVNDNTKLITMVMYYSGTTMQDIGDVLNKRRQAADGVIKRILDDTNGR